MRRLITGRQPTWESSHSDLSSLVDRSLPFGVTVTQPPRGDGHLRCQHHTWRGGHDRTNFSRLQRGDGTPQRRPRGNDVVHQHHMTQTFSQGSERRRGTLCAVSGRVTRPPQRWRQGPDDRQAHQVSNATRQLDRWIYAIGDSAHLGPWHGDDHRGIGPN